MNRMAPVQPGAHGRPVALADQCVFPGQSVALEHRREAAPCLFRDADALGDLLLDQIQLADGRSASRGLSDVQFSGHDAVSRYFPADVAPFRACADLGGN